MLLPIYLITFCIVTIILIHLRNRMLLNAISRQLSSGAFPKHQFTSVVCAIFERLVLIFSGFTFTPKVTFEDIWSSPLDEKSFELNL